jgi:rhamnogalacturonan endolyase
MGNFVSWRFLGTDAADTRFDLIRDGIAVATDLTVTNFDDWDFDWDSSIEHQYQVVTKNGNEIVDTSTPMKPWNRAYLTINLNRPATGSNGGTYTPNDCSVGDVDGDGEYELIVKWDPSNSKDNGQDGKTDNVFIDCYKLNGTMLWRIDLGVNIRAGAHYTQFQVFDFDGDGRAELICKTAPGSKDGKGNYVNQAATNTAIKSASNTKDWRTSKGRVDGGQEYLTVFNGETGEAIHTIAYFPNRNAKAELSEATGSFNWDDRSGKSDKGSYGNRGERYLAATAYLDGPEERPSGIFCRGYYTYAYVWAVDFDGTQLKHRWLHRSDSKTQWSVVDASMKESAKVTAPKSTAGQGSNTMYGNGNHNLSIADVDGDGKDEIIWGSAALDDDGRLLYATGFGHGDAIHLADLDPDRQGLELFEVHEEKGTYAWDIHDAATGEIIWKGGMKGADNGRGMAADIIDSDRGYEFWSAERGPEGIAYDKEQRDNRPYNATTNTVSGSKKPAMNFRIYWDGDLQDELFDGKLNQDNGLCSPEITKASTSSITILKAFNSTDGNPQTCNWTKATPCLQADILGDWREELIMWNYNEPSKIMVYATTTPTTYRVPTLMHDHTYRMGICWQNTAYNQPPHLGYYLPDYIDGKLTNNVHTVAAESSQTREIYDLQGRKLSGLKHGLNIIREGGRTKKVFY